MMNEIRRKTRQLKVGDVYIGGNSPVSVQTMLNRKTVNVDGCVQDISDLKNAGCELVRLAVPDESSALALKEITRRSELPVIADVHYSYKLAEMAIDAGAAKIRMNPGNMDTDEQHIRELARRMSDAGIPVRVGVNAGSLDPRFNSGNEIVDLVDSALDCANCFESVGFRDIVIAIKASDVNVMIDANRRLAAISDYPLHLGVTEAGTLRTGLIKSSIGIGTLLREGIGDTIRVSLSAPPIEEIIAGKTLLRTLGLRKSGVNVVSCPTCARTEIDVAGLAEEIELMTANVDKPLTISVMGCPLNGIGEGKHSDIGIAGGKDKCVLLCGGEILKTIPTAELRTEFLKLLDKVLQK